MNIIINLNIFLFALLFFITSQFEIYTLVMLFALFHELGHLLCGIIMGFEVENLKIMPLGFSVEFKPKIIDYNKKVLKSNSLTLKKILINIAGPFVNVVIILVACLMNLNQNIIYSNLIILIVNLIPIYPLDGGRILKNILKLLVGNKKAYKYTNIISNIFVIIIGFVFSIEIYYYKNIAIFFAIIFILVLILNENKRYNTYKKIYKIIDNNEDYI